MLPHPNAYGVVFGYQMLQKQNPQLNSCMKTEVNSITKSTDRKLARMQTFVLDSLGPLTSVIESDNQRGSLSHIEVLIAVKIAVQLIGNTNPQIYHHCMEVTSSFKKGLQEDENFKETVPLLFGPDFAKKSKEYIDQVKTMRSAIPDLNLSNSFLEILTPSLHFRRSDGRDRPFFARIKYQSESQVPHISKGGTKVKHIAKIIFN